MPSHTEKVTQSPPVAASRWMSRVSGEAMTVPAAVVVAAVSAPSVGVTSTVTTEPAG